MQGGKPRIIDDLKESGVNAAYTSLDKLCLHDVDFLTSLCSTGCVGWVGGIFGVFIWWVATLA